MEYLFLAGILLLTFVMRIIPRTGLKYAFGGDTFFHLYMGGAIRNNKHRIPATIPNIVLDHDYTYPYLYHWLLSFLKKENRLLAERMTGPILDTVNTFIVFVFSGWAVHHFSIIAPWYFPLLVALLFSLSPALLSVSGGPRAYSGSPRILGQTLYLLHITAYFYFSITGNVAVLCLSIFCGSLLLISSKFGVQVLLFFGVFVGIFYSPFYFLVILISIIICGLFTKGRVFKVIEGHFRHSEFYLKFLKSVNQAIGPKRDLMDLKVYLARFRGNLKIFFRGRIITFLKWVFSERYFMHFTIIAFPQLILLAIVHDKFGTNDVLIKFLFLWVGTSIVWFILTSIGYLRFLGEGERYLEFSLTGSTFLATLYLVKNDMQEWVVFYTIYCFVIYLLHVSIFRERYSTRSKEYYKDDSLFEELNGMEKGVILPFGNEWQMLYRADHPLLTYGANIDTRKIPVEDFNHIFYNAHMPSEHINEFVERFKVKYILTNKENLETYLTDVYKDRGKFDSITEKILESKNFIVLKLKDH